MIVEDSIRALAITDLDAALVVGDHSGMIGVSHVRDGKRRFGSAIEIDPSEMTGAALIRTPE
jgi:hypothetical protein